MSEEQRLDRCGACGDPVEVGRAWLELPGVAELADLVLEKNEHGEITE
jgi:hypothetical protein